MDSLILKRIQTQMDARPSVIPGKVVVDKADLSAALRSWQEAEARASQNAKELAKVKQDARSSKVR